MGQELCFVLAASRELVLSLTQYRGNSRSAAHRYNVAQKGSEQIVKLPRKINL